MDLDHTNPQSNVYRRDIKSSVILLCVIAGGR